MQDLSNDITRLIPDGYPAVVRRIEPIEATDP